MRMPVSKVGRQPHHLQELLETRIQLVCAPSVQSRHECHVVEDIEVGEEAGTLDRIADPATKTVGIRAGDRCIEDADLAGVCLIDAVDELQQSRLAAARFADDGADLAAGQFEIDLA